MNSKQITYIFLAFIAILGWNAFLINRDDKLFKAYYHQTAKEQFCNQNASAATCKVK
jgi:hypothetical protein